MKKFYNLFQRNLKRSPGKIIMTIIAVALGTGILILSFSAGSILEDEVSDQLEKDGVILYTGNGEWGADDEIEQERPSEWDSSVLELVVRDIDAVTSAAPVMAVPFDQITVGGVSYNLRNVVGTDPSYFDVFSLDIIAGIPMSVRDIETGSRKIWISRDTAEILFGSAENAVDQWIQPPGSVIQRGPRQADRNMVIQYSVAGVFETPQEVARHSFGIGDFIFPYTAMLPGGHNAQMMKDFSSGIFVLKSEGLSAKKTAASIRKVIAENFGDDVHTLVWEGSPRGTSAYMEELRQTISIFTISVNILGIVLLITSSLGIFSIMVVESLSRRRDIALERSLGASQGYVIREFWSWSLILSLLGALLGVVLALLFAKPVLGTLSPLVGEVAGDFREAAGIQTGALILGVLLALGCGGVLGLLPAFSAVRGNIADILRES